MFRVRLKPGRERSLLRRHPWVFSGAVGRVEGKPAAGETVEVEAADGHWLGRGAWSPQSQISARLWTFSADETVDRQFFRQRLERALALRQRDPAAREGNAGRLVNAESDGLPGVVVDRYGDWLVCQLASAGAEFWRDTLVAELAALVPCRGIYERSDLDVRGKEALAPRSGVLQGEEPPELVEIHQHGCRYLVDLRQGHKTGFYLDQRDNRQLLADYGSDAEVLNGFAYTGALTVALLRGGARAVTNLDSSGAALALGRRQLALNQLASAMVTDLEANAFQELRRLRASGQQFDMVVLDPPKFVESRAQLERASRGYKDINLLGCQLLRPGGVLATFSCSGLLEPALFQKIVADAALDAGRDAQLLRRLGQAADHPTLLSFPEGSYLKGLVCRVW